MTIKDLERQATDPRSSTLVKIQQAFDGAGVVFFDANRDGGPGVRFKS
jgi:hypothetical protein